MTWHKVYESDPLTFTVADDGTVLLGTSDGGLMFRTLANFDALMEDVERARAAMGYQQVLVDVTDAEHLCGFVQQYDVANPSVRRVREAMRDAS